MDKRKYVRLTTDLNFGDKIRAGTVGTVLHDKIKPINHLMIDLNVWGHIIVKKEFLKFITKKEYFIGALGG